ncbi:hypothetical protein V5O48_014719 [Marasmius crinis-equi]|uniref:Uncharacterized protein n=1 Tax=Marasmius crinis-equi TaxID=585013 RepID=A0ABR3EWI7_9AGAR
MSTIDDLDDIQAQYLTVQGAITYNFSTIVMTCFVEGLYAIVFGMALNTLFRRRDLPYYNLYVGVTISLFVVATIAWLLDTTLGFRQASIAVQTLGSGDFDLFLNYYNTDLFWQAEIGIVSILMVVINIIAEIMLIHRCNTVWGSGRRSMYLLIATSVILNGKNFQPSSSQFLTSPVQAIGLASAVMWTIWADDLNVPNAANLFVDSVNLNGAYSITNGTFNFVITAMTGGRIWWLLRQVRYHGEPKNLPKYRRVLHIIFESGVIYPVVAITTQIIEFVDPDSVRVPVNFSIASMQAAVGLRFLSRVESLKLTDSQFVQGIAPTLIIVRALSNTSSEVTGLSTSVTLSRGTAAGITAPRFRTILPLHQEAGSKDGIELSATNVVGVQSESGETEGWSRKG